MVVRKIFLERCMPGQYVSLVSSKGWLVNKKCSKGANKF